MRPITASLSFFRQPLCGLSSNLALRHVLQPHSLSVHRILRVHYNAPGSGSKEPPVLHGEIEYPSDSALQANIANLRRSLARIEASTSSLESEYTPLSTRKAVSDLEQHTKEAQLALFHIERESSAICRQRDILEHEKNRDKLGNSVDKQARMTMSLVTWFFVVSLAIMFLDEVIELYEVFTGKDPEKRRVRRVVIEPGDHRYDRGDHYSDLWRWFLEE
ncbi:hypothetical protein BJ508DRAFT_367006 [Ascobolus immersus RN42]|uniref:Uncharacterized protein n=1 Tax=Ascobolus immersus RN42 TaxID=1160509 RepID=A0A3N4HFA1_ASCIM|nr:hypothetical protein BJ508DRAFT_367006 [Ascobolus immersus RN42]